MELNSFHHVEFVVSNAVQASFWYCANFGFYKYAEKKTDDALSIVVKNGPVAFVFTSPRGSENGPVAFVFTSPRGSEVRPEFERHLRIHGDAVHDVAFLVDCIETTVAELKKHGGDIVEDISKVDDKDGSVLTAKVGTANGTLLHTLIQKKDYHGHFLPGYEKISDSVIGLCENLPKITYEALDHVVENYPHGALEDVGEWYRKNLNLHRFWSVDDKTCHTEYSAMNSWLMVNDTHDVQVTICEPVPNSKRARNQIQEFVDYNGGPGIQHIALRVHDIVSAIESMKRRGVQFLSVPDSYYEQLGARLSKSKVTVAEDLHKLRELKILIDFDDNGYLLQIFTQPVQDRPTLFIEIIQRRNFNGFGAGNFKSLFEAVEREQAKRGTLFEDDDLMAKTY
uniref:4-hydroxyphenylpyruvate dioxygenase n=2 Tax=Steinernema glaseri TaxID=37863 RepID=A0A1I7ZUX9_9BILA